MAAELTASNVPISIAAPKDDYLKLVVKSLTAALIGDYYNLQAGLSGGDNETYQQLGLKDMGRVMGGKIERVPAAQVIGSNPFVIEYRVTPSAAN